MRATAIVKMIGYVAALALMWVGATGEASNRVSAQGAGHGPVLAVSSAPAAPMIKPRK
jgi:hypothetical protein